MSYEQKSHKDVGICGTYTTKMNFDKWHANTDLNLMKTQTSGTLSKDKELHQVVSMARSSQKEFLCSGAKVIKTTNVE